MYMQTIGQNRYRGLMTKDAIINWPLGFVPGKRWERA
jgi:hypothetical protein